MAKLLQEELALWADSREDDGPHTLEAVVRKAIRRAAQVASKNADFATQREILALIGE